MYNWWVIRCPPQCCHLLLSSLYHVVVTNTSCKGLLTDTVAHVVFSVPRSHADAGTDSDLSWTAQGPSLISGKTSPETMKRPKPSATGRTGTTAAASTVHGRTGIGRDADQQQQRQQQDAGKDAASGAAGAAGVSGDHAKRQVAFRQSVEKDVSCLRGVMAQYKEQTERLDMQKKLLLSQVSMCCLTVICRLCVFNQCGATP